MIRILLCCIILSVYSLNFSSQALAQVQAEKKVLEAEKAEIS